MPKVVKATGKKSSDPATNWFSSDDEDLVQVPAMKARSISKTPHLIQFSKKQGQSNSQEAVPQRREIEAPNDNGEIKIQLKKVGKTQMGGDVWVDQDNYEYLLNKKSNYDTGVVYNLTCRQNKQGCDATAKIDDIGNGIMDVYSDHNHLVSIVKQRVKKLSDDIVKAGCSKNILPKHVVIGRMNTAVPGEHGLISFPNKIL